MLKQRRDIVFFFKRLLL